MMNFQLKSSALLAFSLVSGGVSALAAPICSPAAAVDLQDKAWGSEHGASCQWNAPAGTHYPVCPANTVASGEGIDLGRAAGAACQLPGRKMIADASAALRLACGSECYVTYSTPWGTQLLRVKTGDSLVEPGIDLHLNLKWPATSQWDGYQIHKGSLDLDLTTGWDQTVDIQSSAPRGSQPYLSSLEKLSNDSRIDADASLISSKALYQLVQSYVMALRFAN